MKRPRFTTKFIASDVRGDIEQTDVLVALRLVNPLNGRQHWRAVSARAKNELFLTEHMLRWLTDRERRTTQAVTITRLAPRRLDSDNLAASAKHVRDAVAAALGRDDADWKRGAIQWAYAQEYSGAYGVRITLHHPEAKHERIAASGG